MLCPAEQQPSPEGGQAESPTGHLPFHQAGSFCIYMVKIANLISASLLSLWQRKYCGYEAALNKFADGDAARTGWKWKPRISVCSSRNKLLPCPIKRRLLANQPPGPCNKVWASLRAWSRHLLLEHWALSSRSSPGTLGVRCMCAPTLLTRSPLEQWGWPGKGRSAPMGQITLSPGEWHIVAT